MNRTEEEAKHWCQRCGKWWVPSGCLDKSRNHVNTPLVCPVCKERRPTSIEWWYYDEFEAWVREVRRNAKIT